ncbi:MAG: hypothetical protein WEE50_08950, partial [Chloroflexota bacterium]
MTDSPTEAIVDGSEDRLGRSTAATTAPEPRGPHLPDVVTRFGALAWVFLLLGAARLIWFVRESPPPAPIDPAAIVSYGASLVPSVAVVLLPAALLLRHRDAPARARTLLFGTILFAIVEGLRVLNPPLQPIFEQLTPGSVETPYLVPLALIYNAAIGLLGAFAIANIGLGLARARRYEDSSGTRIVDAAMVVAVSLVAAGAVVAVGQLPLDEIPMTPTVIGYLASTMIIGTLFAASWAYLAAVAIRGTRAGELPESGWTVVAIGGGLVIAAYATRAVLVTFTVTPESQPLFTSLGHALSVTVALGYLGLLLGLFLGLPSLEDVDEGDVDEEDVDEEDVDEEDVD